MSWIAERELHLEGPTGAAAVRLSFAAPSVAPEGGEWRCRFRITGLPDVIDQWAAGEDSLQALQLALVMAGVCLEYARLPAGTRLTWLGEPSLGLPPM